MTTLHLEDFAVGQRYRSGRLRVDAPAIKQFAAAFDPQPFHLDEAAVREAQGAPQPPRDRADIEQAVAAARETLGEEQWAVAFVTGKALSLEQAIAEALGERHEQPD
jgi:hypothetical protein